MYWKPFACVALTRLSSSLTALRKHLKAAKSIALEKTGLFDNWIANSGGSYNSKAETHLQTSKFMAVPESCSVAAQPFPKHQKYTETCMATRLHFRSPVEAADRNILIGFIALACRTRRLQRLLWWGLCFRVNVHISHRPLTWNTSILLTLSHKFCPKA